MAVPAIVTQNQVADIYRAAFDQVCDKTDWKNAIDCIVPWSMANLYMQAIEFMTGLPCDMSKCARISCAEQPDGYRILNRGYYAGPCN